MVVVGLQVHPQLVPGGLQRAEQGGQGGLTTVVLIG